VWHRDQAYALAFSPDGTKVLSGGSADYTACLWSAINGDPIGNIMRHEGAVWVVSFSPDGQRILTGAADGTARLWSAENGEPIGLPLRHEGGGTVKFAEFSPIGDRLLTVADGSLALLWADRPHLPGFEPLNSGDTTAIAFSPGNGRQVVTANLLGQVRIWSADNNYALERELQFGQKVWTLAFSPDGSRLLVGGVTNLARLWDTRTWQPAGIDLPHERYVTDGVFSPDGKLIATASADYASIWSALNGDLRIDRLVHPDGVREVLFSPDSSRLLTVCNDGAARVWSSASGELLATFGQGDAVTAVAFSPDGCLIATAGKNYRARLWDTKTWQPTGIVLRHEGVVYDIDFSPDGRRLLTASEIYHTRLWSVATGERIGPILSRPHSADQATFSPDGTRVGTAGIAGAVWGAEIWKLSQPLPDRLPDQEHWRVWVEVITRMEMDADGVVLPLPNDEWLRRKQRLAELGGSPAPQPVRSDERAAGSDE
jgi:WD40 repeat protein